MYVEYKLPLSVPQLPEQPYPSKEARVCIVYVKRNITHYDDDGGFLNL